MSRVCQQTVEPFAQRSAGKTPLLAQKTREKWGTRRIRALSFAYTLSGGPRMASITALLHTENDALRLGRALETLYACDDILVVDHGSRDATVRVAREYGARVVEAVPGASPGDYLQLVEPEFVEPEFIKSEFIKPAAASLPSSNLRSANAGWILCLDPHESLTEKLAASLFEWKSESLHAEGLAAPAFSVYLREETAEGWVEVPAAQTRLVPQTWNSWKGVLPVHEPSAIALEGELLRFAFP